MPSEAEGNIIPSQAEEMSCRAKPMGNVIPSEAEGNVIPSEAEGNVIQSEAEGRNPRRIRGLPQPSKGLPRGSINQWFATYPLPRRGYPG